MQELVLGLDSTTSRKRSRNAFFFIDSSILHTAGWCCPFWCTAMSLLHPFLHDCAILFHCWAIIAVWILLLQCHCIFYWTVGTWGIITPLQPTNSLLLPIISQLAYVEQVQIADRANLARLKLVDDDDARNKFLAFILYPIARSILLTLLTCRECFRSVAHACWVLTRIRQPPIALIQHDRSASDTTTSLFQPCLKLSIVCDGRFEFDPTCTLELILGLPHNKFLHFCSWMRHNSINRCTATTLQIWTYSMMFSCLGSQYNLRRSRVADVVKKSYQDNMSM